MDLLILLTNFTIGCCLGSHALVLTQRLHHTGFIWSSSRCDTCHTQLSLLDEIPIYSYLKNKGRCQFCSTSIPIITVIAELLGGFAFLCVDFSNTLEITEAIFIFYLLIISLQDYQNSEFSTIFIIPLAFITILSPLSNYYTFNNLDWIIIILLSLFFIIQILKKKMGSGDLIIFLLLAFHLGTITAIHILLLGCILCLIYYFINSSSQVLPFIPFIFYGLILNNLF